MSKVDAATLPHVVIVGGGFGGLEVAKRLRGSPVRVTLIDRKNYHLFQPLLYQVATGGLSPANIATPLRAILRRQKNCEVLLAEVTDIDVQHRHLVMADGELEYDYLVMAAGASHSYFGQDQWERYAPGLKTIEDATSIRRKIYLAFEAAERTADPKIQKQLMTFVIVGGGPTGVELAGALAEIARHTLKYDFRHINPQDARILLVEAAPHVLAHYPPELCQRAEATIRSLGVEVRTNTKVTDMNDDQVELSMGDQQEIVATKTILWAAGVRANPLGAKVAAACGVDADRAGRIPVTPKLNVNGFDNVFVIGDLASCPDESGKPLPGLAPVAMQQGAYVAANILGQLKGHSPSKPFGYVNRGSMATIGRAAAVAQIGKRQFSGGIAWIMWLFIHLLQIIQFQNRLLIFFQWGWNYLTFNRSARLITGVDRVVIAHARSQRKKPPAPEPTDASV